MLARLILAALLCTAACGEVEVQDDDIDAAATGFDAQAGIDAPTNGIDAAQSTPDAAPPDAVPPDAAPPDAAPPPTTTLATWLLNGTINSGTPLAVSSTATAVGATALAQSGLTATNFANAFVGNGWPSGARDATRYFSFGVTAVNGTIRYDTVRFSLYNNHAGTASWELRASHDNYATALDSGTSNSIAAGGDATTADVSAVGTRAGTVTFRFYTFNNSGTNSPLQRGFRGSDAGGINLTVWGAKL